MRLCRLLKNEIPTIVYLSIAFLLSRSNYELRRQLGAVVDDSAIFPVHVHIQVPVVAKVDPAMAYSAALIACLVARTIGGREHGAAVAQVTSIGLFWQRCSALIRLHCPSFASAVAQERSFEDSSSLSSVYLSFIRAANSLDPSSSCAGMIMLNIIVLSFIQLGGIMLGHELLHQRGTDRFWPSLVLFPGGYESYVWEHSYHHRHAGTPRDLASTERGTSIYAFLWERYPTHLRSAFRNRPAKTALSVSAFASFVALAFAPIFSFEVALLYLAATLWNWFLVDVGTYSSHYGVVGLHSRRRDRPGHEDVFVVVDDDDDDDEGGVRRNNVAWDSFMCPVWSPLFFGIERHVDHHLRPKREADGLKYRGGLRYPITLELALLVAFVPRLWFRMTDPILDEVGRRVAKDSNKLGYSRPDEAKCNDNREKRVGRIGKRRNISKFGNRWRRYTYFAKKQNEIEALPTIPTANGRSIPLSIFPNTFWMIDRIVYCHRIPTRRAEPRKLHRLGSNVVFAKMALWIIMAALFPVGVTKSVSDEVWNVGGECVASPSSSSPSSLERYCDSRGVAGIDIPTPMHDPDPVHLALVRHYAERNEPFVKRRCFKSDSLSWWSDDDSIDQAAGNATIRVRSLKRKRGKSGARAGAKGTDDDIEHEPAFFGRVGATRHSNVDITVHEFLDQYDNIHSEELLYAAQIDIASSLPRLLPHLPTHPPGLLDAICPPPPKMATTMYIGAGAPITQLHYDSYENVVCIVAGGYKVFELYDPITSSALLYFDQKEHGNASPIPHDKEEMMREFPMAKYALPSRVRLDVGDCLYLPIYWFHSVISSKERTISINWWRVPEGKKKEAVGKLMCGHTHRKAGARC